MIGSIWRAALPIVDEKDTFERPFRRGLCGFPVFDAVFAGRFDAVFAGRFDVAFAGRFDVVFTMHPSQKIIIAYRVSAT